MIQPKIKRKLSDEQKAQARERMKEAIDHVGSRRNLQHCIETNGVYDAGNHVYNRLMNMECRGQVAPNMAIVIEAALPGTKFTREYLCPDLRPLDFERVEAAMEKKDASDN